MLLFPPAEGRFGEAPAAAARGLRSRQLNYMGEQAGLKGKTPQGGIGRNRLDSAVLKRTVECRHGVRKDLGTGTNLLKNAEIRASP